MGVQKHAKCTSKPRQYRLWGPPSLLSNGYREGSFPGVKQPEREADHSPPFCAEVKYAWSYTSNPQYIFTAKHLVKHWVSFNLPYR
jgi:hypothetical protein